MSSVLTRIEIYDHYDEDGEETWSYGCPDLDLMGYGSVIDLLEDVKYHLTS